MNVSSYSFQSTYPNPVQIGTPNPQAQVQNEVNENVENKPKITQTRTADEAKTYLEQTKHSSAVNVSTLSTSSAVGKFSEINSALQAQSAYQS